MQTLIEELLDYEHTPFAFHTSMRIIDPHLNTKKWIPKITIETNNEFGILIKKILIKGKLPFKSWWSNGQKWDECEFVIGSENAMVLIKNGQQYIDYEYLLGKRHGPVKRWYENGQLEIESNYKDGKKVKN